MVSRWSFPQSTGGVAMHNHYLLNALEKKFKCNSISNESEINLEFNKNNGIRYSGIPITKYGAISQFFKFSILNNAARSFVDQKISRLFAEKLIKESGIIEFMDIHSEGYFFLKTNPEKRKNVVIRSHTPFGLLRHYFNKTELKGVDTWFAFEREKKCFNWAGIITTPSKDLKLRICDMYSIDQDKVQVIPNLLDTNHFSQKDMKDSQDFTILHVGRFERAKGVETLIKAFIAISKKFDNIKLINVGIPRGPSFNKCMDLLKKNKLDQKVIFTGFVDYLDLPEFYAKSDIVIVPSEIYESFSYTVAQGMACGKPVIASKIGGIPETTNYGNAALLFEPGNVDQLTNKIERLYTNTDIREEFGRKARKYIVDYCSIDSLKEKYIEFYQSILN
jgi:glycosyltransferase involved in cell wall biosynthesis